MELTVILKLLGRNIGYNVLYNRILNLWKPTKSFHLMDTTNGYFLVKLQDINDYNKVLTQGPWIVFGQYLTVQPWTKTFNPSQPYPSVVMAWIRLPGLLGYLKKRKIIEAIRGLIGKVVKLDLQTDTRTKGRFARLAVFINLDMPLVSQVLVDGAVQRVEYKALPTICFNCGKYGHVNDLCPAVGDSSASGKSGDTVVVESDEVVDERAKSGKGPLGTRFAPLDIDGDSGGVLGDSVEGFSGKKGAGNGVGGFKGNVIRNEPFKVLGCTNGVGRGAGVDSRPASWMTMMSKAKKSVEVGLGLNNGLKHAKGDGARFSGSLKVKPDGLSGDRLKHFVPLASDGLNHSDLNSSFLNGHNFNSSQHGLEHNRAIELSNSSENVEKSLILNNPMFERPCETVFNLEASILDPKQHSVVIFNESNEIKASKGNKKIFLVNSNKTFPGSRRRGLEYKVSVNRGGASFNRAFKDKGSRLKNAEISRIPLTEAMSSMANLLNSNVEGGAEGISSSADRQIGGLESTEHKPDLIGLLETRVSGVKADSVIAKLSLDFLYRVEAVGFSGGIWIGWKNSISVEILRNHSQFILIKISGYTVPVDADPWLAIGDFNAILDPCEKQGGRVNRKRCALFGEFMDSIGLQDLGFSGPNFTWNRGGIFERLDRAICDDAWCLEFPLSKVLHLQKLKSDHRPLKLTLLPETRHFSKRPFQFLAGWVEHSGFLDVQKAIDERSSPILYQIESEIRDNLESVLHHEELLWKQKARCDWLAFGDRNTRFFHRRTLQRRKFNRIIALRNQAGEWIMDEEDLKQEAVNFYKNLYGKQPESAGNIGCGSFPILEPEAIQFLNSPISDEEIKKALFDMAPLKAPGNDRFMLFSIKASGS
ncbi:hypothetical protein CXB51_029683 [Gossypium anomalum]|uniref:CCHC-type domain-containing protein n=1 Tax=Gossypium anomalum TaxID=47600 RepID=A0A8J5Y0X1_9ROSI|nr:hypothetical protein CXB51_029683 [Gossypium anomalum]